MRNEILSDLNFINGCNKVIKNTLAQYSGQLRQSKLMQEPTNEQYASAEYDISNSLLHDIVLMEVRSFVMKYEAMKRSESREKKDTIEGEIDKIQNSACKNDRTCLDDLKEELQKYIG